MKSFFKLLGHVMCTQGSSVKVKQKLKLKAQNGDVSLDGCAIWYPEPVWVYNEGWNCPCCISMNCAGSHPSGPD